MSVTHKNLKDVFAATYEARNKWTNLLLALGVDRPTIESIRAKHHNDPDECFQEGLFEWLRSGEKSWRDMTEALSSPTVGHRDIAGSIEKKFLQLEDSSSLQISALDCTTAGKITNYKKKTFET